MLGLFDSGLGGLTVAKAILEKHPQTDLLYLGDTARAPYGNKGKELIQQYAIENARWLIENGATAIGIACNTASVAATETLRTEFPDIPVYNVIEPVIEEIKRLKPASIGVMAGMPSSRNRPIRMARPPTMVLARSGRRPGMSMRLV